MTPGEVKFELEMEAQARGVSVVGVHSVVLIDNDEVDAIFDIRPDESGCGLHFAFPLPQSVSRSDLRDFAEWLARPSDGLETLH
jgi:hypothetical protein